MAGPKTNTIEYVFQGDTLSLQQAIKKVDSLLRKSTKTYKSFQAGVLTDDQKQKIKATRKLLKELRAAAKEEATLDADQRKKTLAAGREALKQANHFAKQSAQAELQYQKRVEQEKLRVAELTSLAGRESAKQTAAFLETYADRATGLSNKAYDEIKQAVADYREAAADTTITEEDLAAATIQLNSVYKQYSKTLRTAVNAQETARKGIISFNNLMAQAKRQVEETVKSFSFWVQLTRQVVNAIKQGVENAADYAESINYLNAVTGKYNKQLAEFVALQERAFGSDPTQLRTSVAMFYQFGESLGWSSGQAAFLAEEATKLAQDLASLQNVDLRTAMEKLRSGAAGQTKALQAWGISVHDASIEEWLLSKGINRSLTSMNEATQAAARYAFIVEKTTEAQGDLARTIKSPANQLRILNTQVQLLFQNLGSFAIPAVISFVRVINAVLQPVNAFMQAFTAASTEGFTSSIGESSDALYELQEAEEAASAGLTGLDEINQAGSASGSTEGIMPGIEDQIAALLKGYDNMAERGNKLTEVFGAFGEALAPVYAILTSSPIEFTDALTFLGGVLEFILTPLTWFGQLFQLMPSWLQNTIGGVAQLGSAILVTAAALSIFKTLSASSVFKSFISILKGMWTAFLNLSKSIIENTKNLLANNAAALKAKIASAAMGVMLWWESAAWWAKAIAVIAAAGAAALVVAGIVAGATAVAGASQAKAMSGESAPPAMAKGGVVTGPTLALVGEGRYNEAVMPLGNSPQFRAMKQSIAEETAGRVSRSPMSAGGTLNSSSSRGSGRPIILQLNGREVARALLPEIGYTQRQTGVELK